MAEQRFEQQATDYVSPREAEAAFALWAEGRQEDLEHGRVSIKEMAGALGIDEAQARALVAQVRAKEAAKEREAWTRSGRRNRLRRLGITAALAGLLAFGLVSLLITRRAQTSYAVGGESAVVAPMPDLAPESVAPSPSGELPVDPRLDLPASHSGIRGLEATLDGYTLSARGIQWFEPGAEAILLDRLRSLAQRTAPAMATATDPRVNVAVFAESLRTGAAMPGLLAWSELRFNYRGPGTSKNFSANLRIPRLLVRELPAVEDVFSQELERRLRLAANIGVRLPEGKPVR